MACFVMTSLLWLFTSTVLLYRRLNLCCHAYGFRELKVCICPLSVQFFLYVAYLQLHLVIIRNNVVYPIFKLNSHITFVFQCLRVRDFKILHWWSLSPTRSCTLSDSKQNYLPTQTLHCVWCDTRHPFCTHDRYPCTEGTSLNMTQYVYLGLSALWFIKIPVASFQKMLLQPWFTNICFVTQEMVGL